TERLSALHPLAAGEGHTPSFNGAGNFRALPGGLNCRPGGEAFAMRRSAAAGVLRARRARVPCTVAVRVPCTLAVRVSRTIEAARHRPPRCSTIEQDAASRSGTVCPSPVQRRAGACTSPRDSMASAAPDPGTVLATLLLRIGCKAGRVRHNRGHHDV